jgi:hypothetical protein
MIVEAKRPPESLRLGEKSRLDQIDGGDDCPLVGAERH